SLKTDGLLGTRHVVSFDFGEDRQKRANAGLDSGFALPARAYSSGSLDRTATLRVTSAFSDRSLNEFRVRGARHQTDDHADSAAPAVLVFGAFNGGGNQENLFLANTTDSITVSNVTTLAGVHHDLR